MFTSFLIFYSFKGGLFSGDKNPKRAKKPLLKKDKMYRNIIFVSLRKKI